MWSVLEKISHFCPGVCLCQLIGGSCLFPQALCLWSHSRGREREKGVSLVELTPPLLHLKCSAASAPYTVWSLWWFMSSKIVYRDYFEIKHAFLSEVIPSVCPQASCFSLTFTPVPWVVKRVIQELAQALPESPASNTHARTRMASKTHCHWFKQVLCFFIYRNVGFHERVEVSRNK